MAKKIEVLSVPIEAADAKRLKSLAKRLGIKRATLARYSIRGLLAVLDDAEKEKGK